MDDAIDPRYEGGHQSTDAKASNDHKDKPNRKRSKSGGILGGLSFLKSSKDTASGLPKKEGSHGEDAEGTTTGSTVVTVLRQSQGRKRTGSLRQAAMAKLRKEVKQPAFTANMNTTSLDNEVVSHPISLGLSSTPASTQSLENAESSTSEVHTSTATASIPTELYASTTDEDENMSAYGHSASSSASSFHGPAQKAATSLLRRRSNRSKVDTSQVVEEAPSDLDPDDEWDYSETEWWGWVLLTATWIVFVVGMGSCLGVWSWAWDVGETPYAPPDLEDDATLPITGYYPALIVCTAVMSWVWVVVAWVGMKYFRHSKVVGEEG